MGLGLVNATTSLIYQLSSLLDVKKYLSASVKSTMEGLVNSRIDFAPIETLTSDKTTGWIGIDYMRLFKFIGYMFRNMDRCIAEKNHNNVNIKTIIQKCAGTICYYATLMFLTQ